MFFLVAALWLHTHTVSSAPSHTVPRNPVASASAAADTTDDDLAGGDDTGGDANNDDTGDGVKIDPVLSKEMRVRLSISPKTVTVGQRFTVTVHARVPADLVDSLRFPDAPESDDMLSSVAPPQRHYVPKGGYMDAATTYVFSAWAPIPVTVSLGHLSVGNRNVAIPDDSVDVRSVLPAGWDSVARAHAALKKPRSLLKEPLALRILRVLRIIRHPQEHKQIVIPLMLALLAAVAGGAWWWRHRQQRGVVPTGDWVEREFQRIEAMRLLEKGESDLHAILMATVLRQYLIRTFATVRASATTREVSAALHGEPLIPAERVLALFERVDLLKFAHAGIQGAEAKTAGIECRGIVNEILDRHQAAVVALEAQRQARTGKKSSNGRKQAA